MCVYIYIYICIGVLLRLPVVGRRRGVLRGDHLREALGEVGLADLQEHVYIIHMHVYVYIVIYIYIYIYIIHVCMYVCMYVYIYIYIYGEREI